MAETRIGNNYNNLYNNSLALKNHLDSNKRVDLDVIQDLKTYLVDFQKNPTRAQVVYRDVVKKNPIMHPAQYSYNKTQMSRFVLAKDLMDSVSKIFEKQLYPKTHKLRKSLIQNDRIALDTVVPKLTSKFAKFLVSVIK